MTHTCRPAAPRPMASLAAEAAEADRRRLTSHPAEGSEGLDRRRQAACRGSTRWTRPTASQVYGIDLKLAGHVERRDQVDCPVFGGKVEGLRHGRPSMAKPGVKKRGARSATTAVAVIAETWWQREDRARCAERSSGMTGPNKAKCLQRDHPGDAQGRARRHRSLRRQQGRAMPRRARLPRAAKTVEAVYGFPLPEPRHHGDR